MSHLLGSHNLPERFLRQLWRHQHFRKDNLLTIDSKHVEILSPGVLNRDGGPDFREALVRIDGISYRGDIETHQYTSEWIAHAHHLDPKYNGVILHVVLHDDTAIGQHTKSKRSLPVLALEQYLNSSYHSTWEAMIMSERSERLDAIKCYDRNDDVEPTLISQWLSKLALERMELKVRRFEERLRELISEQRPAVKDPPARYGEVPFGLHPEELPVPDFTFNRRDITRREYWEQLLYEGIMEALGYSKNQQPFLHLAQHLTLDRAKHLLQYVPKEQDIPMAIESMLLNVAGLIPLIKEIPDRDGKKRARKLRDIWKLCRNHYHRDILHQAEWQFFRLRPENFPTVRLAGAARLIGLFLQENVLKSIIHIIKDRTIDVRKRCVMLEEMFIVRADEFWSSHYQLKERAKRKLQNLIGAERAHDIIINVVVPVCLLYARLFKDKEVRRGILKIFNEAKRSNDNFITRTIERQLLKNKLDLDSALLEQGAIQLYKQYCVQERCSECAIGKTVFRN